MRPFTRLCCLAGLLFAPMTWASDFEETKQEIPDSSFHASMQARQTGPATDPASRARHQALFAHADCVRTAKAAGDDVEKTCAATRAAYSTHLPKEFSGLQIMLLEQRLTAPQATER